MTASPNLRGTDASLAAVVRRTPIGLYYCIAAAVPDELAAVLPWSRPGVPPHITLAHSLVSPDQIWALRSAFERRTISSTLAQLEPFTIQLDGVGDFRTDVTESPLIYLRITNGADQLGRLAASFDKEYELRRRFKFHPHLTLAWRDRELSLDEGNAELDRLAAAFAGFKAAFPLTKLTYQTASGTILAPRDINWGTPRSYLLS